MGFVWYPTGSVEAGIDGFIEIRDPNTGAVSNNIIQVQSKATAQPFQAETAEQFEYTCNERDLDYWLQGNAPVVLVVSRPASNEAYWVSIKDYFSDIAVRKSRRIRFNKQLTKLTAGSAPELIRIAVPRDSGVYFSPPPKNERLISNLLSVSHYPRQLFLAETDFRSRTALWAKFKQDGVTAGPEWILRNKRILSFHDLHEPPWSGICDPGTIEVFDTDEWALSPNSDLRNDFADLLQHCLRELLWTHHIRYDRQQDHFHVKAPRGLKPQRMTYVAGTRTGKRTVFQPYPHRKLPGKMAYYRHYAFVGRFLFQANRWYLEITPTYRFTSNGYDLDKYSSERLKGIKRLDRNPAVLAQLLLWVHVLTKRNDLLRNYDLLEFGELCAFEVAFGIVDEAWIKVEEDEEKQTLSGSDNQLGLF
jgi:hypothetical protein